MKESKEMMRLDKDLKDNPELKKKFIEAMKEAADSGTYKNDIEVIIQVAKPLGYEISMEEMERSIAANEEMDPEEMEQVAGGERLCEYMWRKESFEDEYGHSTTCITAWHCRIITLHTSTESKDVNCFANYRCADVCYGGDLYSPCNRDY